MSPRGKYVVEIVEAAINTKAERKVSCITELAEDALFGEEG